MKAIQRNKHNFLQNQNNSLTEIYERGFSNPGPILDWEGSAVVRSKILKLTSNNSEPWVGMG